MDTPLDADDRDWLKERLAGRIGAELRRRHGSTDDLVQETLGRLERAPPRVSSGDPALRRRYLLRIAENLLIDWIRYENAARRSVHDVVSSLHPEPLDLDRLTAPGADPPADAARGEMAERVLLALELLEPDDRHVIVRRQLEGLAWAEVGAAIGVGADAARMRFGRALGRLAAAVGSLGGTPTAVQGDG